MSRLNALKISKNTPLNLLPIRVILISRNARSYFLQIQTQIWCWDIAFAILLGVKKFNSTGLFFTEIYSLLVTSVLSVLVIGNEILISVYVWHKNYKNYFLLRKFKGSLGTCMECVKYISKCFKMKDKVDSIFFEIFSPFEHVLTKLQSSSFPGFYSQTYYCCYHGIFEKTIFCHIVKAFCADSLKFLWYVFHKYQC